MIVSKTLIEKNRELFQDARFVIVQHLLKDTLSVCNSLIGNGIEISAILSKPYSHRDENEAELKKQGVNVYKLKQDEEVDYKNCKGILDEAESKSKLDNKKILIMDLGGYYSKVINDNKFEHLAGVVEDTAYGHRKYKKNPSSNHVVFSVAESEMKEIEAKYVGASIVDTTELLLQNIGDTLYNKNILLVGYGMIGKNVAKRLSVNTNDFVVYDNNNAKTLQAVSDGYGVAPLETALPDADAVIGVTGNTSISLDPQRYKIKKNAMLISGSSNRIEFDVDSLGATNVKDFGHIKKFSNNERSILLFNNGEPVNFLTNSVPDEIIDLMFAEMIQASKIMITENNLEKGSILKVTRPYLDEINSLYNKELISNPAYSNLITRLTDKNMPKDFKLKESGAEVNSSQTEKTK